MSPDILSSPKSRTCIYNTLHFPPSAYISLIDDDDDPIEIEEQELQSAIEESLVSSDLSLWGIKQ